MEVDLYYVIQEQTKLNCDPGADQEHLLRKDKHGCATWNERNRSDSAGLKRSART